MKVELIQSRFCYFALTLFGIISFQGFSNDKNSTDLKIKELVKMLIKTDSLQKADPQKSAFYSDSLKSFIESCQLTDVTLKDVEMLTSKGWLYKNNTLRVAVAPALIKLSKAADLSGAVASVYRMAYFPGAISDTIDYQTQMERCQAYIELAKHPSVRDLIQSKNKIAKELFLSPQSFDPKAVNELDLLSYSIQLLSFPMSFEVKKSSIYLLDVALKDEVIIPENIFEPMRKLLLKHASDVVDSITSFPDKYVESKYIESFKNKLIYIDGNFGKKKLIGNTAPEIPFTWCSDNSIKNLSDLKGKVILIDFWATWCGPCIKSFPNIRKLQERYKDYPVVILGVTSLQGYHNDIVNKKRYDTKGEPEKEIAYMSPFMKDMEITWNIAFSPVSAFNPNYGVRGIPHAALIDAKGNVRYNVIRPYDAPWHEAEKIDMMLKEAGLKYPTEPMEKINYANPEEK